MEICLKSLAEGERQGIARLCRELTQELNRLSRRAARIGLDERTVKLFREELQVWAREQNKFARETCKTLSGFCAHGS